MVPSMSLCLTHGFEDVAARKSLLTRSLGLVLDREGTTEKRFELTPTQSDWSSSYA